MKKILNSVPALFVLSMIIGCQSDGIFNRSASSYQLDTAMLHQAYDLYKEPSITHRRFKHADIDSLIQLHKQKGILKIDTLGKSYLGKAIYQLKYGEGENKVMLWSQMHGNEPTATMALLDIFNFLEGEHDGLDSLRQIIKANTTLYFVPMLNPDGADMYTRRTAQEIDMNRDARAGSTVEGRLLIDFAAEIKPDFGFNLHDQNIYHSIPETGTPVTISLLAPAYNYERDINDVRGRAMRLAAGMNAVLQHEIPGAVARYDDAHTPRGFGDNFQKWGASTVLIESGGYKGDPEKQYIRKLNFMIILNALLEIADGSYDKHEIADYESLPPNDAKLTDVLLRGVTVGSDSAQYVTDISIRRDEVTVGRDFYLRSRIDDLGDLLENFGYEEVDEAGFRFVPGKIYPKVFSQIDQLSHESAMEMLRDGYIAVQVSRMPSQVMHDFPLVIFNQRKPSEAQAHLGREAHFFLEKDGELHYAVVNGTLIPLQQDKGVSVAGPARIF